MIFYFVSKVMAYLVFEATITLLSIIFLIAIGNAYKNRDARFPALNKRKTYLASILLLCCFVIFNAIPDFVFFFMPAHSVYLVVSYMWTIGIN